MHQILIATRNSGKAREFRELLGSDFAVSDLSGHPEIPEIAETGQTFLENAQLKSVAVSQRIAGLILGDDSGLEVDALGGAPGIFSARYSGASATSSSNIRKLLADLGLHDPEGSRRSARFRCVLVLAQAGQVINHAEGVVEGEIVESPRGSDGFGYDPIFQPLGYSETFAELPAATKNVISHRAQAVKALRAINARRGSDIRPF